MNAVLTTALPESLARLQAAFDAHADRALPVRQQAFARFMERGFPTTHDEHWKYTNLRRLESRVFATGTNITSERTPRHDGIQLTFIDGILTSSISGSAWPGLRLRPLSQLSDAERNQVLTTPANDTCRFAALNTALCNDGLLIEVERNARLDQPIELLFHWSTNATSLMAHPRIVVRAAQHSRLTLIERYQDSGSGIHWHNAVTTIALDEGAQLEHCRIQAENSHSFHLGLLHAELAAQAQLLNHQINFGAALGRMDINVFLRGAEAEATLNGLQFATGTQHHDTHIRLEHGVPHTRSRENYRGIADQRGRVVFNGKVVVAEHARKTDAEQSSRNLLLAKTAEIDTKPELEIYNDDVKCAHGATVGQLDANALFYLRSRGLNEAQARALLTHAFADHIISQLPVEALRQQLAEASHARFAAQLDVTS